MEYTDLGILNVVKGESKWVRVTLADPKNPSSMLDSIMTSVASGDVDNNGKPEIIAGGYLWDNSSTDPSYTKDWSKSAGELYLAYLNPEELTSGSTVWRSPTIPGDDNKTASTRYINNSDFDSRYKFNNHALSDTSIYLSDDSDNPSGLCRSVNWCNWTIPLAAGSLGGYENGSTMDEVYFDKWFYRLGQSSFEVYKTTPQLTKVVDNNNITCVSINVGQITTQDASGFNGTEEFMVFYAADLEKNYDNGDTEWVFVIYSNSDGSEADRTYSVDMPSPYRDIRPWGLYNVGRAFVGNFDNDTYYVDFQSRMFTYTDPTVIAVIAPVPYDQDLSDILFGGADAIGSTDFTRYNSHESGSESTCNFEVGPSGGIDTFVKADMDFRYTHDESWSQSKTVSFSTSYSSSHESVAAYVIPTDVYFYKVYGPASDGTYTVSFQYVPFYGDPVQTMFEYEEYCTFIDNYNEMMSSAVEGYVDIPKVGMSDNVEGDITSYEDVPGSPLQQVPVYYNGSGVSSSVTQCVDLSKATGRTWANGGYLNLTVQASFIFASVGGGFTLGGSLAETETDVSGMSFSSTLAQGMEVNYLGEMSEARSVLSQYSMTGSFWAEMRSMDFGGVAQEYVYVGYTVDSHTSAPKLGNLIPDVYVPGGDDEDDSYNPTDDAIFMQALIPGTADRAEISADEYVLQVQWQGRWYPVDGNNLGFTCYVEEDGHWSMTDGVIEPSAYDSTLWLKVDGLSSVTNTEFKFRLDAVRHGVASDTHNPCLLVTGYKDTRTTGLSSSLTTGHTADGGYGVFGTDASRVILVDKGAVVSADGRMLVFIKTDLAPGERVELWFYGEDTGFTKLSGDLHVYTDGFIVYDFGKDKAEGDPTMMLAGAIALLVTGIVFLAVFNRRR